VTRSVYIVGGPGSGKSTMMAELLDHLPPMGEQADLWSGRNARGSLVTLRGHYLEDGGVYLGKMRDTFPGTDGLDRVSHFVAEDWLAQDTLPPYIIAEGAGLANQRFLPALAERTDMLLVHLWAEPFVIELRCLARGSSQNASWMKGKVTAARNLFNQFRGISVDTADPAAWGLALAACLNHLKRTDHA
jgi:hypothetical protein